MTLDWHNGNRCVLVDPRLSGLTLGMTLATTPAEIYRSLLEATAFGARCLEALLRHRPSVGGTSEPPVTEG